MSIQQSINQALTIAGAGTYALNRQAQDKLAVAEKMYEAEKSNTAQAEQAFEKTAAEATKAKVKVGEDEIEDNAPIISGVDKADMEYLKGKYKQGGILGAKAGEEFFERRQQEEIRNQGEYQRARKTYQDKLDEAKQLADEKKQAKSRIKDILNLETSLGGQVKDLAPDLQQKIIEQLKKQEGNK